MQPLFISRIQYNYNFLKSSGWTYFFDPSSNIANCQVGVTGATWSKNTLVPFATVPLVGVEPGVGLGFEVHAVSLIASYGKLNFGSGVGETVGVEAVVGVVATTVFVFVLVAVFV